MLYLITFAVMWNVFRKREEDLETEYRLNFARICTTFIDAMQAISKAIDTEPEQTTLDAWTETLCRATGCEYIGDAGCTRTDEDYDGTCPCDIDMRRATEQ